MKVDIDTQDVRYADAWLGFRGTAWQTQIDVRDFIQHNYTPYEGDESFLADATPATTALWEQVMAGIRVENATHAPVDFDTNVATSITAHAAGYINQPLEKIVGLQTDQPLKRALHPFGGIKMIKSAFEAYGREMDPDFEYQFTALRKTHNQGVFDVYSPDMLRCRKSGVLTGLPDGYGRGRIIGDYRRVALYGIRYPSANVSCSLPTCSRPASAARRWRPPCACARSWPNSGARCCRCRRWRPATAAISLTRRALPGRRCSGSTSPTWRR